MLRPVGIDLGTTHTVVCHHGSPCLFSGSATVPSVVAYPPTGRVLVGGSARLRRAIDPKNTISSAKRVIGESWGSYRFQRFREVFPYEFVKTNDGQVGFRTRAGVQDPRTVAKALLSKLMSEAGIEVSATSALVTVPAAFGKAQRDATAIAVAASGFGAVRLIEEPVATAVAYLERSNLRYAAVYDLGGGTFDLAVIDCTKKPFRVIGNDGDPFLGGDDVDRAIAEHVARTVLRSAGWDLKSDRLVFDKLLAESEQAKIRLSREEQTTIDLSRVDEAAPPSASPVEIDRELLSRLTHELLQRTLACCDRTLSDAGIRAKDIQAVFLAGGATLLPGMSDLVGHYFGRRPRVDINPLHVVGLGASLVASRPRLLEALDDVFAEKGGS